MNRVLIVYMVRGTGHHFAALALEEAFHQSHENLYVQSLAAAQQTYPFLGNAFNQLYLQVLKRSPKIWEYLYDHPGIERITRGPRNTISHLASSRAEDIIHIFNPNILICTQATAATAMAAVKRKGKYTGPLFGVVTDFFVHRYWIQPEIDLYFVAHARIKRELIQKGVPAKKIAVTGIPIMPEYNGSKDETDSFPQRTILLLGGGKGLGPMESSLSVLKEFCPAFHIHVICGQNEILKKTLQRRYQNIPEIHIEGTTNKMAELISQARVVITKPGGLTTYEVLSQGKPLILLPPLPGPEKRNSDFLVSRRWARQINHPEEIKEELKKILRRRPHGTSIGRVPANSSQRIATMALTYFSKYENANVS